MIAQRLRARARAELLEEGAPRRAGCGTTCRGRSTQALHLGDSKNTVRGHCLDIPRFEESLNNFTRCKQTFEEQGI